MRCLICEEDIPEEHFSGHINTKHDEQHATPWKYIIAMQKRLEEIEGNIEKSHGPIDLTYASMIRPVKDYDDPATSYIIHCHHEPGCHDLHEVLYLTIRKLARTISKGIKHFINL